MYDIPFFKELILIGGGHSHVHTLKMFGMQPLAGVRVTLISREINTPYSGMIPGYIAGYYTKEECHIDLIALCNFANIRFLHCEASGIDTTLKLIHFKDGRPSLSYDVVSIDIGISPKPVSNDDIFRNEFITAVKPIDRFATKWIHGIVKRIKDNVNSEEFHIVVIGGGAGGVELCFSMQNYLLTFVQSFGRNPEYLKFHVVSRSSVILPGHNINMQKITLQQLARKNIQLQLNAHVIGVEDAVNAATTVTEGGISSELKGGYLVTEDGRRILFHEAILCTQASPQSWLRNSSLELTEEGFICVKSTLESTNTPDVFATGDISHVVEHPRPKAGVFAVRAGPILTANLRRRLLGEQTLETWIPQSEFLAIIGTGDEYAIASKGPIALQGEYLWRLKQQIDKQFMSLYQNLPLKNQDMSSSAPPTSHSTSSTPTPAPTTTSAPTSATNQQLLLSAVAREEGRGRTPEELLSEYRMRCGACGSKISSQVLQRALRRVSQLVPSNSCVVAGIASGRADDAALIHPPGADHLLVHSIDYFRSATSGSGFTSDPYLFGQIAAIHSLSDLHAMGATPVSAMALCVLPVSPPKQAEDTLVHLLAGACRVLAAESCALVGGHTSEAFEGDPSFAMGLSVHGVIPQHEVLRKGPLPPSLHLVLTKALGTGVLMAADMKGLVRGDWVAAALSSMLRSSATASRLLQRAGCRLCTDVTGFGLIGHLVEMLDDGSVEVEQKEVEQKERREDEEPLAAERSSPPLVELWMDKIPALPGAIELLKEGIVSSLHSQNGQHENIILNATAVRSPEQYPYYQLLFDPQTCGGLLAAVAAERAEEIVEALQQNGYTDAVVIGRVLCREELASSVEDLIDKDDSNKGRIYLLE